MFLWLNSFLYQIILSNLPEFPNGEVLKNITLFHCLLNWGLAFISEQTLWQKNFDLLGKAFEYRVQELGHALWLSFLGKNWASYWLIKSSQPTLSPDRRKCKIIFIKSFCGCIYYMMTYLHVSIVTDVRVYTHTLTHYKFFCV